MATATNIDDAAWLLRAQDVSCQRSEHLLWQHLNLCVRPHEAVWVRGPNGRGKTSLLRLLAGLSHTSAGLIEARAPLVYLGHQHALKDDLTVQANLGFLLRLHALPHDHAATAHALEHLGIGSKRHARVGTLSQGQRRRVALARLVLSPPTAVWLLDEPFDALDDQGVAVLQALIGQHRQAAGSVILSSHQAPGLPDLIELHLDEQPLRPAPCGH